MVAPPKAPLRIPISVMPVCTVERKRVGFRASTSAVSAPLLPSSARCCSLTLRAETIAISAREKNPLVRMSRIRISISVVGTFIGNWDPPGKRICQKDVSEDFIIALTDVSDVRKVEPFQHVQWCPGADIDTMPANDIFKPRRQVNNENHISGCRHARGY